MLSLTVSSYLKNTIESVGNTYFAVGQQYRKSSYPLFAKNFSLKIKEKLGYITDCDICTHAKLFDVPI